MKLLEVGTATAPYFRTTEESLLRTSSRQGGTPIFNFFMFSISSRGKCRVACYVHKICLARLLTRMKMTTSAVNPVHPASCCGYRASSDSGDHGRIHSIEAVIQLPSCKAQSCCSYENKLPFFGRQHELSGGEKSNGMSLLGIDGHRRYLIGVFQVVPGARPPGPKAIMAETTNDKDTSE